MDPGNDISDETEEIWSVPRALGARAKNNVLYVQRISTSTNILVLVPHLRDPDYVLEHP